ncbi:hypothetical protein MMC31_001126, partial [Peltigera leucophlebia]|nr:hypothetical protein [Peltigera leucophlebia]
MPKMKTLQRPEVSAGTIIGHARCGDCWALVSRGILHESRITGGCNVVKFSEGCQRAGSPRDWTRYLRQKVQLGEAVTPFRKTPMGVIQKVPKNPAIINPALPHLSPKARTQLSPTSRLSVQHVMGSRPRLHWQRVKAKNQQ